MKSVSEEKITTNGYNLHVIQTKKYKTINVVVKLKAPLKRETITQRALIPYILQQGTENYPSARMLRTALDDLYGAVFNIDSSKKGENHIISIRIEFANEAYLSSNEQIIKKAMHLLNEVVFHPKSNGDSFDTGIFKREKQTLQQKIDSIVDDKMSYANMRLIDEMCKEEAYRLHVHGYTDDLNLINETNLYEYYRSLLVEDQLDIYVLGDLEGKDIQNQVAEYFSREVSTNKDKVETNTQDVTKVKEITEAMEVQQGKLHLGFRTNIRFNDPEYYALQVFNGIFGGFPSSKLFMNVREKHSLAYYAASRFESHKGLLFVFSGIAPADFQKAKDIILEQMEAMKKGEFTEEQVDETKNMVVNQLKETMDHPQGLIEILYHQVLANNNIAPEEMIEGISQVTKDDLLAVGEKIQLDTVYFLTSKGGSINE
ncbi:EF-P 5-aminopentanol modification-associated protein YfmF [Aquibacillus rhizosphaerae]|uniref:Pitrilysin family protein n=1 Tax=Aquibacillus rhizosphaerae TaxID=3051431 RepID=A0ABT7KZT2_9BACI|nr:pitrilysin family protein [Aquibacillus sp. LR5S19]MDL4839003.1 pitrilysin family protein [Aquibacillus sp. LR5S19]